MAGATVASIITVPSLFLQVCRLAVQRGFQAPNHGSPDRAYIENVGCPCEVTSLSRRGENPEPGNAELDQVKWVKARNGFSDLERIQVTRELSRAVFHDPLCREMLPTLRRCRTL